MDIDLVKKLLATIKKKYDVSKEKLGLTDSDYEFLKRELKFMVRSESLMRDILYYIGKKKFGGTKNAYNSMIFYVLGITTKKPDITKEFNFEYELDRKNTRLSPPDVDIDFEHTESILKYLEDRYGAEKVALIGTSGTYGPKAALQFCAKAMNVMNTQYSPDARRFSSENDQEAKRLSKIIPNLPSYSLEQWLGEEEIKDNINQKVRASMDALQAEYKKYPKVFEAAKNICGLNKNYGTHAAGVIISYRDVSNDVPLFVAKAVDLGELGELGLSEEDVALANRMSTQYDWRECEDLGLLKFDLLQINTLRQMSLVERLVKERHGKEITVEGLKPNDPKVFKTINDLKLEGLFQISGNAFTSVFVKWDRENRCNLRDPKTGRIQLGKRKGLMEVIGCHDFNDIIAANALGRPGALAFKLHEKYREAKNDPSSIQYPHPDLKPILAPTYGQLCLDGNTEIYDEISNRFAPIKEFEGKRVTINSIDNSGNLFYIKDREVVCNGEKECIRIEFSDGGHLDCTPDHNLFTEEGPIKACDSLNKYLLFSKKMNVAEKRVYSDNKARILGMLIGDGDLSGYRITLCCKTEEYREYFKSLVLNEFPDSNFNDYFHCRCFYTNVNSGKSNKTSSILEFTRKIKIQNHTALDKVGPEYILTSSMGEKIQFLIGYFDTDGCVRLSKEKGLCVFYKTASKKLAIYIKNLLLTMGYHCSFFLSEDKYYQIDIDDKFNFLKNVLMSSGDSLKIDQLVDICKKIKHRKLQPKRNTYSRMKVKKELVGSASVREFSRNTGISRHHFYKSKNDRIRESSLLNEHFNMNYSDRNCVTKKVVNIKKIGIRKVYDILNCLPRKCFFISNGLMVSNCFQEQLIKMCMKLAGFSFSEADKVRQACGKKIVAYLVEMEGKFREGCKKNNIPESVINQMWDTAVEFGNYAFNAAHSTAYGYIAYQTAWLKTYYPTEFICATLTAQSQKDEESLDISKEKFLMEYKKLNILPVDVNKSKLTFYPEDDLVVRAPLDSIKGIGPKASEEIVINQPYVSVQDFMARVGSIYLNTRELQVLQECGALDSLGTAEYVAREITSYTKIAEMTAKKKKAGTINAKNLF